jgi:hypothetical protein
MEQPEFEKFRSLLTGVYALYARDISVAVFDIWWATMRQFDYSAVADAFTRHATDPDRGQFLPKPADVVRLIGGGTQDAALVAWAQVDRALRVIGPYQTVVFDDPIVHAVISDMGGWIALGRKSEDEWPFAGKEFENRYRGYRTRGKVGQYPRTLIGIMDFENRREGHELQSPILIGDEAGCWQVLSGGSDVARLTWKRADDLAPKQLAAPTEVDE